MCIGCKQPLGDGGMLDFIQQLDDNAQFGNHQYAACKSCHILKSEGLCVFPQKTGTKLVTGRMIKVSQGCCVVAFCGWGDGWGCGWRWRWVGDGCVDVEVLTR